MIRTPAGPLSYSRALPRQGLRRGILGLLLLGLLLAFFVPVTARAQTAVPPAAGDGRTTATAYRIAELGNLVWLGGQAAAGLTSGTYYTLANDIDASDTANWNDDGTTTGTLEGFRPIGTYTSSSHITDFCGIFDGGGHRIVGLTIYRPTTANIGFFGCTGPGAVIKNLKLAGGATTGFDLVGALVGDCIASTITNCQATGTVTGGGSVGGLVGYGNDDSTISRSYASGAVTANSRWEAGGLVGSGYCEIANCFASGSVTGSSGVGGLVGCGGGRITNCYAVGAVTGSGAYVGGLAGSGSEGTPTGLYWDTESTGKSNSALGTGKTTAAMHQRATFAGWDFSETWDIVDGLAYPFLRSSPPPFALEVSVQGKGTLSVSPNGGAYLPGTVVCLQATPDPGFEFFGWEGAASGSTASSVTITMNIHKSATARFAKHYSLLYAAGPGGSLVGVTSQTVWQGQSGTTVLAVADPGLYFARWSDGSQDNPRTDPNVAANVAVTAIFSDLYSLVYRAGTGGTLTGATSQTVVLGSSGTPVQAVADAGWSFIAWSDGLTNNPRTDGNVDADIDVTARFCHSEIRTLADLQSILTNDPECIYTLMNDIDASDTARWNDAGTTTDTLEGFAPIGSYTNPFLGVFDGNGYKITGLTVNRQDCDYAGLFGYVGTGGFVRNLTLTDGSIVGRSRVGAVIGCINTASIENCHSSAYVAGRAVPHPFDLFTSGNPGHVGGLIGYNNGGTITGCSATGQVVGTAACMTGMNFDSDRKRLFRYRGYPINVGGLVGTSSGGGIITRSWATGTVRGWPMWDGNVIAGGLIGATYNTSSVTLCFASSLVYSSTSWGTGTCTGGLAGLSDGTSTIADSFATGAVSVSSNPNDKAEDGYAVGGLVGSLRSPSVVVTRCYATGLVTGNIPRGGLVGANPTTATVAASYWDADTTSQTASAGGARRTTAEMHQKATFAGWDFTGVWTIAAQTNGGYPFLATFASALPTAVTTPWPTNGADGLPVGVALGWRAGDGGAADYDVYFGTEDPPATLVASGLATAGFAFSTPLQYATTYYWRVDARNAYGAATGNVWHFTTMQRPEAGTLVSRRLRSAHAEAWIASGAHVVAKDTYSFSAKVQLPTETLAALSNATTLSLVLGDVVTTGAAHTALELPLSAATRSTLAGHPTAKRPKDPSQGGAVSFVEYHAESAKKARVVTLKWTKAGLLSLSIVATPAVVSWPPAGARAVQNVTDLSNTADWPAGKVTGLIVPALVDLQGVFMRAEAVTCSGRKGTKPSDGGELTNWSVSGN